MNYVVSNVRIIGIRLDLVESGRGLIEVISRELPGRHEENHQNSLFKIFGDLAEIRNDYPLLRSFIFPSACWVQPSVDGHEL